MDGDQGGECYVGDLMVNNLILMSNLSVYSAEIFSPLSYSGHSHVSVFCCIGWDRPMLRCFWHCVSVTWEDVSL